ncbi:unnamed protein product, partial [marine sediment metagenome]
MTALPVLIILYLGAIFAEFLSPTLPLKRFSDYKEAPPVKIHFVDEKGEFSFRPFVYELDGKIDPDTFRRTFVEDKTKKYPIYFFVRDEPYRFWGVFHTNIHLFGLEEPNKPLFLFGTDKLGRDLFTRILHGSRISLSFGLASLSVTFFIGLLLGGISGYFGGTVDNIIQRGIDLLISLPVIPLWMVLAAALPRDW